jgi:hypothetical protein
MMSSTNSRAEEPAPSREERKRWVAPVLLRLDAGSAENNLPSGSNDGFASFS